MSRATVVGIPVGIAGASLTAIFTVKTGVVKKLLNITRKKKKKHNKIITLARNKLNIIENLISQALIDFDISYEKFSKIIYEKDNYEQMKDNIRNAKSINDLNKESDGITPSKYKYYNETMLSYCLKCKKNTESINPKLSKTSNSKTMILSKCAICGNKKSKFIKEQQAKGLLSNLGIRTPLNKIPLLGDILFSLSVILLNAISLYKMNNIINKFLLAGGTFMPEMPLRQPQFTYSACGPFTKHKQKFKSLNKLEIQTISTKIN